MENHQMIDLLATTGLGSSLTLWIGTAGVITYLVLAHRERRDP